MKNKEYGIKLNLDTSSFNQKIKDVTEKVVTFTKKAKENLVAGFQADYSFEDINATYDALNEKLKKLKAQEKIFFNSKDTSNQRIYKEIEQQINETEEAFKKLGNTAYRMSEPFGNATNLFWNLGHSIRDLKNNGIKWVETEEEMEEKTEDLNTKTNVSINIFQNFERSIKKGINSIKRFTLSMLGVQSIYSMLSRATHAYMSQDDAMHNKLQANWIALGAIMEPIVNKIIELFTKLVGYINVFVKAFTNGKVDIISKALDKVKKKANGASQATKSLASGLDEITNLDLNNGGLGSDVPSISDYIEEMQNMELNPKIVEKVENLAKKLREVWDWIEKNKEAFWAFGVAIGVVIAGLKIGQLIKDMTTLFNVVGGGSVAGGAFFLWGMVVAGIVADLYLAWELGNKIVEAQEEDEKNQEQQRKLAESRLDTMKIIQEKINEINDLINQGITTDEYGNDLEAKRRDLINEAKENYYAFDKELQDGKRYTQEQVDEMNNLRQEIEGITQTYWGITIHFDPKLRKGWLYDFGNEFANGLSALTSGDWGKVFSMGHFARGNVAYGPTIAEFGEYAGASSNPEITTPQNIMKETLYEALSEALPMIKTGNNEENREVILNVNGRELARATYGDYQSEAQRLGSSNVAIRRV